VPPVAEAFDPTHDKVLGALSDERWDFRTAEGIAEETDLTVPVVREILREYPDQVRVALVQDVEGRVLYRLRERGPGPREREAEKDLFLRRFFR
jgi:hypothetical protein